MKEIYKNIPEQVKFGQPMAICTVVETKGSTPQKPGAKLLLLPDFRSIGTLGGGCVEAEAKRQALGVMQSGVPKLFSFQLDDDFGWDDSSICGGVMKIFVDLPKTREEAEIFINLQRLLDAKVPVALATVVKANQEYAQIIPGQKLLISNDSKRIGELSNRELEREVISNAQEALKDNQPRFFSYSNDEIAVFIEPHQPLITLVIAGAGHIGQALAHFGKLLDFEVVMIDDRPDFASKERCPDADKIIVKDIGKTLREYRITDKTYIVIVTRGHQHDEEVLLSVIDSPAGYIGMIGSRRKVKLIYDDLIAEGIRKEKLAKVYAPIGLDIGSKTVTEIAVSIVAQLVKVRSGKTW
ncbi:MAG: XdhC family protein [Planctomycetota bacterium]|jgi:xanthine dehydrogenase accessory factor